MFNTYNINTQEFSNFVYYTMAEKGYFKNIIEELPKKLSDANSDMFVYFEIADIHNNGAVLTANALVSLFIKNSMQGIDKSAYENKFNELLSDAYGVSSKLPRYTNFGVSKSYLPKLSEVRDGYKIISQPIVIRKRNINNLK